MKLSISNIAWDSEKDKQVYELMKTYGYVGLEIAPTRVFPEHPYDELLAAKEFARELYNTYEFQISSMQSIWYGRSERIFGSDKERDILAEYTQKAIDFAATMKCKNIVFGCPKNRSIPDGANINNAVSFFRKLGEYACKRGTVIGMEANPAIYNTNFINDTLSAIELIKEVNSRGFLLNLDIGTVIANSESLDELVDKVNLINHVHISEPYLKLVEQRELHKDLAQVLKMNNYDKFISIEMGKVQDISDVENTLAYVSKIYA